MIRRLLSLLLILFSFQLVPFGILGDIGGYNINVDSPVTDINPAEYLKIKYRVVNYGYIFQQDSLNGNIFGETLKNDFSFNHSHPALAGIYYPVSVRENRFGLFLFSRLIGTSYLNLKQDNANLYVYDYPAALEMKLDLRLERDEITTALGFGIGYEVTPKFRVGFLIERMTTKSNRLFTGYAIDTAENYEYTYVNKTNLVGDAYQFNLGLSLDLGDRSRLDILLSKIEGMEIEITKELTGRYDPELPPIMAGFNYCEKDNYSFYYPIRFKVSYLTKVNKDSFRLELEIIPAYENSGVVFSDYPHLKSRFNEVKNLSVSPKARYQRGFKTEGEFMFNAGFESSYKKSPDPRPDDENGKTYSEGYISNSDLSIDFLKIQLDFDILYKFMLFRIGLLNATGTGKIRAYDIQSNKTVISDLKTSSWVVITNLTLFF
ncbi:MAG TPA: hypothetical protein ENN73_01465 [Firmicutes bacterium]|nr:hypothetical protein [Bacillota bacterium]